MAIGKDNCKKVEVKFVKTEIRKFKCCALSKFPTRYERCPGRWWN